MKNFFKSEAFIFAGLMALMGTVFLLMAVLKLNQFSILMGFLGLFFYGIMYQIIKDYRHEKR